MAAAAAAAPVPRAEEQRLEFIQEFSTALNVKSTLSVNGEVLPGTEGRTAREVLGPVGEEYELELVVRGTRQSSPLLNPHLAHRPPPTSLSVVSTLPFD